MFTKRTLVVCLMTAVVSLTGCEKQESPTVTDNAELASLAQKANYIIGRNLGKNLQNGGLTIELQSLTLALADVRDGKESRIPEVEMQKIMQEVQQVAMAQRVQEREKLSEANAAEGNRFLEANKAKEGVTTTASGLQYEVIIEGKGPKPSTTDSVTVHYVGRLINGTEFDNSVKRGRPASFPVTGVIRGWSEALQLMPQGSKWRIVIPSELAYGAGGQGQVPPASTLIFEVELLEIKAPAGAR